MKEQKRKNKSNHFICLEKENIVPILVYFIHNKYQM